MKTYIDRSSHKRYFTPFHSEIIILCIIINVFTSSLWSSLSSTSKNNNNNNNTIALSTFSLILFLVLIMTGFSGGDSSPFNIQSCCVRKKKEWSRKRDAGKVDDNLHYFPCHFPFPLVNSNFPDKRVHAEARCGNQFAPVHTNIPI